MFLKEKDWISVLHNFGVDTEDKFNRTQEIYKGNIFHLSKDSQPFESIKRLLEILYDAGYKLGIASGNYGEYLRHQLKKFELYDFFDIISGHDDFEHIKPDPEQLNFIVRHMCLEPREMIYVGDMIGDMSAGKSAGYGRLIGAAYGWHKREILKKHGADAVVDMPMEILNHVE